MACNCCNDEGCVYIDGVAMMCPECVGNPECKGCGRNWNPVRKSGYCEECEDAIREDIEDGKRDDRRISNAEAHGRGTRTVQPLVGASGSPK